MKLFMPLYEALCGSVFIFLDILIDQFNLLKQYQTIILMISMALLTLSIVSVCLLSKKRGFFNYCKSLNDTSKLRQFLRQQNSINDFTSKAKVNLDQRIYNSTLWHTYIDYTDESMEVWVAIPNSFKAKKLLDSNLDYIAQEVSSYTEKYICSGHIRKGGFYIYKGEKK